MDNEKWEEAREQIWKKGVEAKYQQCAQCILHLLSTGNTFLAYSDQDSYLGTGLKAKDPGSEDPSKFTGKNQLGHWLMEIRSEMVKPFLKEKEEEEENKEIKKKERKETKKVK